jgi:hypothetical protein
MATKKWHRSGKFNRHHIVNKTNGGSSKPSNILKMDVNRHRAWHFLFRNMSFQEVAELLLRCQKIKDNQH